MGITGDFFFVIKVNDQSSQTSALTMGGETSEGYWEQSHASVCRGTENLAIQR